MQRQDTSELSREPVEICAQGYQAIGTCNTSAHSGFFQEYATSVSTTIVVAGDKEQ